MDSLLSLPRAWVQSPLGELRSHKPRMVWSKTKKKKKKEKQAGDIDPETIHF